MNVLNPGRWVLGLIILAGSPGTSAGEIAWALGEDPELVTEARTLQKSVLRTRPEGLIDLLFRVRVAHRAGTAVERIQRIFFYGTDDAVNNNGTDTVSWNPVEQDVQFLEAIVLRPDGVAAQFNPETVQVVDTDSFDVFTDERKIVLHLPELARGSVGIISYERTTTSTRPYFFLTLLQSQVPRHLFDFRLDAEGPLPQWHAESELVACETGASWLHCKGSNLPPANIDPVVNYADVLPALTVSEATSWDQVIETILPKIRASIANSTLLEELAADLGRKSDFTAAALDFVSRKIRYVSVSQGEHAIFPHHIDRTIRNRYGDCKDKSAVLLALLQRTGRAVYPVLVATERSDPSKLRVPGTGYFDHMILCRQSSQGEHCFDPTDGHTDPQTVPASIQGKVRLNLTQASMPSRISSERYRWRLNVDNVLEFSESGGQTEKLRRIYVGEYASWMRTRLSGLTESEQGRWLAEQYQETVLESADVTPQIPDLQSRERELEIKSTTRFEPFADITEDLAYADYSSWLRAVAALFRNENEYYDYEFPGLRIRSEYHFDLRNIWVVRTLGPELDYVSKFGTLKRGYRSHDNGVSVTTELEMPATVVSQKQKEAFNGFIDLVTTDSAIRIWGRARQEDP